MKKICLFAGLAVLLFSCSKMNAYKKYEQGRELIYPSPLDSVQVYSGKNRVLVSGLLSGDPNVVKYRIFWSSGTDSLEGAIHPGGGVDTIRQIIDSLPEGPMSFVVRTYDNAGNISIPINVTGNVYGQNFQTSIDQRGNRLILNSMLDLSGAAAISWADLDGLVTVPGMDVKYYDYAGGFHDTIVAAMPTGQVTQLPNFDVSKTYQFQTIYKPDSTSIDTFVPSAQTSVLLTEVIVPNNVTPATNSSNDGSRWAILNNWITNSGAENHGGYGGIDMRDNSIFFEGGYGAPSIDNGKIYQVAMLPPGTYTFDGSVNWWNNNGNNYIYVVAAQGNTGLPDASALSSAISYGQLTNGSDVQTQFTLTQPTLVSFGVVMNMGDDGESIRFNSLRLYINH
jgi:hypothetical protein